MTPSLIESGLSPARQSTLGTKAGELSVSAKEQADRAINALFLHHNDTKYN
jgi:hypothetical protein